MRGCPRTRFSPCDEYRIENIRAEVDPNLLDELIDLFVSEGPKLLDNIEQAIQTKDAKSINFASHRLKGSSACLGVTRVCTLCREIEEQSRNNELDNLSLAIPMLRLEYHRAILALNLEKQKSTA